MSRVCQGGAVDADAPYSVTGHRLAQTAFLGCVAASHRRASATATAFGPSPVASMVVPSTVRIPTHVLSVRRVRDIVAPSGSCLNASPFLGKVLARRCCSTSFATHAGQRVLWNFAWRCARYLSTA